MRSYNRVTITSARLEGLPPGGGPVPADAVLAVTGELANDGPAGSAVLQLYFNQAPPTKYARYVTQLAGFARVALPAGASGVPFSVPLRVPDLAAWDPESST